LAAAEASACIGCKMLLLLVAGWLEGHVVLPLVADIAGAAASLMCVLLSSPDALPDAAVVL
jgi:hypothetical protein